MYAITSSSYRAIAKAEDAQEGETVVDEVPQSLLDAIAAAEAQRSTFYADLVAQAEVALAGLRTYRDNQAPTSPQTVTAVKLLCRVGIGLIRLQLAKLDAAD